jgi:excinuclease ABC subunit A
VKRAFVSIAVKRVVQGGDWTLSARCIELRGVRVHNLKSVDLDVPHGQLVVFCGVSGSGKTSLALDTLYAEGQRRYIESFSAYTRQFLDRLEKPDAERIDGIPPAIAVTRGSTTRSNRATIGSTTETADYLRLLYARIGEIFCLGCGQPVRKDTPQTAAERLSELPDGTRFPGGVSPQPSGNRRDLAGRGSRIARGRIRPRDPSGPTRSLTDGTFGSETDGDRRTTELLVVTDRLTAGGVTPDRLRDSLEIAFAKGPGTCCVLLPALK